MDSKWNHGFQSCWNKPLTREVLTRVIVDDEYRMLIPWNFHAALAFLCADSESRLGPDIASAVNCVLPRFECTLTVEIWSEDFAIELD